MATGVPNRGKIKDIRNNERISNNIRITYPEKLPEDDILTTSPAEMIKVWVGERSSSSQKIKRLYYGDNLSILASLLQDKKVVGKVRLVYIDPPFSTQSTFHSRKLNHAYDDVLRGAEFIEFLRKRLVLLRELLSDDGSIYLHLDEKMVFHMKIIMDEVFGEKNYKNCITRKKCNSKNYTRKTYGNISDYILFYTKSSKYVWNKPLEPWVEERTKEYQYIEPETGRRYMKVPIHAPGIRRGETGQPWRGMLPPPGKHWQYKPSRLDEMDARGVIYWSPTGNPRRKIYLDESAGIGVQDIWLDFKDAHNQNIKITGYPTEKNSDLLKRIIEASSNPKDIILDCFSGSGTTLAVADKLDRNWMGVDNSFEAIQTTLTRFVKGIEPMGDFINSKNGKKKVKKNIKSTQLFDSLNDTPEVSKEFKHSPITDFIFLADSSLLHKGESLINKWKSEFSENRSPQLKLPCPLCTLSSCVRKKWSSVKKIIED